jgi:hypothetical protein
LNWRRHGGCGILAGGGAILTIIGLISEWHDHYIDFEFDLLFFGLLTVLTGLSGLASLLATSRKKSN